MKTAAALRVNRFMPQSVPTRRSSKSRSRLHTDAVAEYLARQARDEVTEGMDQVVDRLGETASDGFVACATLRTLTRSKW